MTGEGEAAASRQIDSLLPSQETYPRLLRSTFCDDRKCALDPGFIGRLPVQPLVVADSTRALAEALSWFGVVFARSCS